ncbi:MAG: hypothetical protein ACR2MX_08885 [Cyclobacteriaceae bacterium]
MSRKSITLFTGHYWGSKRKAGFHWLASALVAMGYEVLFFTAPLSYLHKIKGHYQFELSVANEKGKLIEKEQNVYSFVHFTLWHVANLRFKFFNWLSKPLFRSYQQFSFIQAEEFIKHSSAIIFESTPGLFLFDKVKRLNPKARFIYRVSDDLRMLKVHPDLIHYEKTILNRFDLVSVPSQYIHETLFSIERNANIQLQYHGIDKRSFDQCYQTPYPAGSTNLVFIGNNYFDHTFLEIAAGLKPEWTFHIIGPIDNLPLRQNVIAHGEVPFDQLIAYVKFADIGLHTLKYFPGAESFTDSLKIHQYTYCKLPIIAPDFLGTHRDNMYYYEARDKDSIGSALNHAINCQANEIENQLVSSWTELANALVVKL